MTNERPKPLSAAMRELSTDLTRTIDATCTAMAGGDAGAFAFVCILLPRNEPGRAVLMANVDDDVARKICAHTSRSISGKTEIIDRRNDDQ